ncbi:unnamed protein product [Mytilus edulis]|uniref:Uncharacterized protein n=1 Tax=Mytilus edulis TaxID=6550 RepID=A0A8S3SRS2_MYTED|nr:unnamed protein product [Mytilus edulis]
MHAENHIVDSRKIKGLVVRGFDSEVRIPLPQVFTRDIMPANRSHIPTAEMARRWSYLEHLAEKLMPVRDCEFGLFIGYNCPRALIPREVIPSIDNGPYGQKTDLGWGIVGIVDPLQIDNCDSIGFSHRTLALEVPNELSIKGNKSGDSEHVYFSFGSSVKEIIPSEVARLMELDFSDRNVNKISYSYDDKRFISILDEGISVENGHCRLKTSNVKFRILQECCSDQIDWDEPPSEILIQRWQQWRNDIQNLAQLGIQRCVKPKDFGNITVCELHHFSDASTLGYGQCSYLRLIDENGLIHCTLLMGKARVTPRRLLTIPRLELSAAIVSIRISQLLKQELQYENITEWFWTDSNIVLGYIANDNRRFHIFVANRVQQIREHSSPTHKAVTRPIILVRQKY